MRQAIEGHACGTVGVVNCGVKGGQGDDDDRKGSARSGECRRVKGLEAGVRLKNWSRADK